MAEMQAGCLLSRRGVRPGAQASSLRLTCASGGQAPENPAPVLKLTDAAEGSDGHGSATAGDAKGTKATASGGTAKTAAASDDDGTDTTARVLGIAGIVIGAAGVTFGVLAGRRRSA